MAEDEAFFSPKGENSRPLFLQERGFLDPVKSKMHWGARGAKCSIVNAIAFVEIILLHGVITWE
jgi:hypothetical protein